MISQSLCPTLAVKKVVDRYEKVAGANVNFNKSEGLLLGGWRGGIPLPELYWELVAGSVSDHLEKRLG